MNADARARMRLVIAGDGPQRAAIEAILREADAAQDAWLAGERSDIELLMRGLDAFVLPSLAEGISNTILEAMATGLPVVATDVGGNRELIDDGITGRIVPSADPERLAQAMLEDFCDRDRARGHSRAAREAAEKRFSLDRMVADYCALYQRELARVGRGFPASESFRPF
jgi:glycosyltransferase involved in cell wall biosynthesis